MDAQTSPIEETQTTHSPIEKYTALVVQPHVRVASDRADIKQNLDRVLNLIDFGVGYFWELQSRLVVLPEYFLQGVTTPGKGEHGIDSFMKKAIAIDGPEMQALGDKAREYNLYIAGGGVVEQVAEFPTAGSTRHSSSDPRARSSFVITSGTSPPPSASAPAHTTCSTNTAKCSAPTFATCFP